LTSPSIQTASHRRLRCRPRGEIAAPLRKLKLSRGGRGGFLNFAASLKDVLLGSNAVTPVEIWFQDEARVGQKGSLSCAWARLAKGFVRRSRME
jgi:hypothetical protein